MGAPPNPATTASRPAALLSIAFLAFISIGLPDSIAGVAWPSVRSLFGLHQSAFGLVFIALSCGYCTSGFFGGSLMMSLGLGNLLWVSSGLVAIAMFGFSLTTSWPPFVACAVIWGLGSGGIDAGLNSYSAHHFSPLQVNWMHACYSVGATIGPLLMTAMLYHGSWRFGYVTVGIFLLAMMVPFLMTRNNWKDTGSTTESERASRIGIWQTLCQPLVCLQMILFLVYVGLEFTLGQWSFTVLTESRKVPVDVAGPIASCYYAMIGVGRVLAGMIVARIGIDQLVRRAMMMVLVGTILFTVGTPHIVGFVGLAMAGFGLAPMFPCLMARTPERLGTAYAIHAVGFQASAGMIGGALMPGLAGILGDRGGLEFVPWFSVLLSVLLFGTYEFILHGGVKIRPIAE